MKIEYTKDFIKDVSKIKDKIILKKLNSYIEKIKKAKTITELPNIVKISGSSNFYRARLGDYRLIMQYVHNGKKVEVTMSLLNYLKRNESTYKSI